MNNKIFKTLAMITAAITLCSCESRVELLVTEPAEQIIMSVQPAISNSAQTRTYSAYSTKETWANNDKFGFYANLSVDTLNLAESLVRGVDFANLPFTYNGTAFSSSPATLYFPYREQNLDLWGIYPYDANAKTKDAALYAWTINPDQTTNIADADLLVAIKKSVVPTSSTIDFTFQHKMTHIVLDIIQPESIDGRTVKSIETVTMHNVKLDALYNFNKDAVTTEPTAEVQTLNPNYYGKVTDASIDGDHQIYEAIIAPQTISSGAIFLQVIVNFEPDIAGLDGDQGLYAFRFDANTTFASGNQHTYTLTFDADFTIRLAGSQIEDWNEVDPVTRPEIEENN